MTRYRLYYNNPAASLPDRRRDGKLVYRFFDDFPGTDYDHSVWYVLPSGVNAVSVSNGILHQDGTLAVDDPSQGNHIRMVTETFLNVPTFSVSYSSPFAAECRFRSLDLTDSVRPANYLMKMSPPGYHWEHDEYTIFIYNNPTPSRIFDLRRIKHGSGSGSLANSPTEITVNQWYDYKVTVRLTNSTPGSEFSLHSIYLDDALLDDTGDATQGGYDSTMTSGIVGIETNGRTATKPGSKGDYDWFLVRDFKPNEPALYHCNTGAADVNCDGVDNDCDGSEDEGYVPQQTSCGVGACASVGVTSCVAGVEQDSCTPGQPSVEICDGQDNDCDATVDNAQVPADAPALLLGQPLAGTARLSWGSVALATGYDVVRGSAAGLWTSLGDFAAATGSCLADDAPATTLDDSDLLPDGQAFWYLVRAVNCAGAGTYDDPAGSSQAGLRDAEIQASGVACP